MIVQSKKTERDGDFVVEKTYKDFQDWFSKKLLADEAIVRVVITCENGHTIALDQIID